MNPVGGWLVWTGLALLAWTLPGSLWRPEPIPPLPLLGLGGFLALLAALALVAPQLVVRGGRALARSRMLAALEAPPPLLWGLGMVALWPAPWGPPGFAGWITTLLLAILPTEVRWLAQALPEERPFPAAWGDRALAHSRRRCMAALLPEWLAARLPVWIMATLVVERVMGLPGLGSDWVARVAARDRAGLLLWVVALAGLWALGRRRAGS